MSLDCFLVCKVVIPNILAFCIVGTVEQKVTIGYERYGESDGEFITGEKYVLNRPLFIPGCFASPSVYQAWTDEAVCKSFGL